MHRVATLISGLVFVLAVSSTVMGAEEKADATLELSEGSVAVGIGFSWGNGTLHYRGKRHPFKVSGLTVNTVGASKLDARGNVYGLKKLEDFNGTYTSVSASGTAGGGKGISRMKNANGVAITLHSVSQGLEATAGPEGVTFTLQ